VKSEDLTIETLRKRHTCSVEQASHMLGIGRSTAYAAVRDGSLPVLRVRNRLLVPTAKLLEMLGVEREE
jgi:excisionase family DNA binding protein